jgi:hypothetical protein
MDDLTGGMDAIVIHTFNLAKHAFFKLSSLRPSDGRKVVKHEQSTTLHKLEPISELDQLPTKRLSILQHIEFYSALACPGIVPTWDDEDSTMKILSTNSYCSLRAIYKVSTPNKKRIIFRTVIGFKVYAQLV